MKPVISRSLLVLGLVAMATTGLHAATPVIGSQLFQETDARIDDLFQRRNNPPKPPGPADNPFHVDNLPATGPVANPGDATPTLPPGTSDEVILRQAASSLVFGGLLQVGDVQVLVINKASYKEGGILGLRVQGTLVYLRIVNITANSVTLGLNEARLTLRF